MGGAWLGAAVAAAGGAGAVLRYLVDNAVSRRWRASVPLGTVVVNVTGCFALGVLVGLALDRAGTEALQTVLGVGLLGGYTTFGTASVDAVNVASTDGPRAGAQAAAHALGMLVASLAAAEAGLALGRLV